MAEHLEPPPAWVEEFAEYFASHDLVDDRHTSHTKYYTKGNK